MPINLLYHVNEKNIWYLITAVSQWLQCPYEIVMQVRT